MSVDLLESADVTEIRLLTFLAKTIREISSAAGITSLGPAPNESPQNRNGLTSHSATTLPSDGLAMNSLTPAFAGAGSGTAAEGTGDAMADLNFEQLFGPERQMLDLGSLLGLPGDNGAQGAGGAGMATSNSDLYGLSAESGYMGEFGFGMGGMGMGFGSLDEFAMGMNLDGFGMGMGGNLMSRGNGNGHVEGKENVNFLGDGA